MKRVVSGLLLSLGTFVVSSLVVTPPAEARRCGKSFKIMRSAGSKARARAKSYARKKVWRRARRRCKAGRVAVRATKVWRYSCRKRGKLNRCSATARFRCCRTGKLNRISRRGKRLKKRWLKRNLRIKRRIKRRKKRARTKTKRRFVRRMCLKKIKVRGRALSSRKGVAKKVARSRVYRNARLRCKRRAPRYVARWQYACSRDGKNFSCVASNVVRCCRGKRLTRRKRRRTNRRRGKRKRRMKRPTN